MAGKRGKTIRQLVEESKLPMDYQDLLIENHILAGYSALTRYQNPLHHVLTVESFTWAKTKQGEQFWKDVQTFLNTNNPINKLPPIPKI